MVYMCVDIHTQWNTTQPWKNSAICSHMDIPRNYYTKWSKPDREKEIPFDITSMWNQKKIQINLCTKQIDLQT